MADCEALLELKSILDVEGVLNWSNDMPIVEWDGVTVAGEEPRVTELDLQRRDLSGNLPSELAQLTGLKVLNLSRNYLNEEIPPRLGDLANLEILNLKYNQLSGIIPIELTKLRGLHELNLSFNRLTGKIPPELGNLENLAYLHLHSNNLTGIIPVEIADITSLNVLTLHHNTLVGHIPPQLGDLRKLSILYLNSNELSGKIPVEIGQLTNLQTLDLSDNRLTGSIPIEFAELSKLRKLYLHENHLTGEIPQVLGTLSNLWEITLDYNVLEGCLPYQLKNVEVDHRPMPVCDDPTFYQPPDFIFKGGVDLAIRYIERTPKYELYRVTYWNDTRTCRYPYTSDFGPVLCDDRDGKKRWPEPGELVELKAHIKNYGDEPSAPFSYYWTIGSAIVNTGRHEGLQSGEDGQLKIQTEWPETNLLVSLVLDPTDEIEEILETNNELREWMTGYTLGIYFLAPSRQTSTYEVLTTADPDGISVRSPERWVHDHVGRLNKLLADAGLTDRIRVELLVETNDKQFHLTHELRYKMDGWWMINYTTPVGSDYGHSAPAVMDHGLLHEWMHQLGVIDIYRMHLEENEIALEDANRPGELAGCNIPLFWGNDWTCYRFPDGIEDMMGAVSYFIGAHTAGGLRSNAGHRRGYYGEYLFDTPTTTTLRIVDIRGNALPGVRLSFFQKGEHWRGANYYHEVDSIPEFTLTTDENGRVALPNQGVTGILTATGHQLRPNPFGVIDVVGYNGIFIIEMESDECTNYEWLTIVELNLAYWDGHTDHAEFTKTLRCPPPS